MGKIMGEIMGESLTPNHSQIHISWAELLIEISWMSLVASGWLKKTNEQNQNNHKNPWINHECLIHPLRSPASNPHSESSDAGWFYTLFARETHPNTT